MTRPTKPTKPKKDHVVGLRLDDATLDALYKFAKTLGEDVSGALRIALRDRLRAQGFLQ